MSELLIADPCFATCCRSSNFTDLHTCWTCLYSFIYNPFPSTTAISSIVYIVILYLNAQFVSFILHRFSSTYRQMTTTNKRTSTMYILNILHTSMVLILQLIASPSLAEKYTVERTDLIRIAATIVSLLYLFEIIYRESMRIQMLIHHFAVSSFFPHQNRVFPRHFFPPAFCLMLLCRQSERLLDWLGTNLFFPYLFRQTLFAICLVAATLDASHHPSLIVTALVWLFQAS